MKLELERRYFTERTTIGTLSVDGVFECFTLEDRDRGDDVAVKVPGETAIPAGEYVVVINHSPRFGIDMPLLLNVPGFSGVRIHPGNKATDTLGCILVGQLRFIDEVRQSQAAWAHLMSRLTKAQGPILLSITRSPVRDVC